MNILALACCGQTKGNTHRLTQAFLQGCQEAGHQTQFISLAQTNIQPCLGCNGCHKGDGCIQSDDMNQIYQAFSQCDLISFATPLYFWGPSAQMKLVIDRFYALGVPDAKGYFSYPQKKCVLLATAADSHRHFWVFEYLQQYYRRLTTYLNWVDCGTLCVGSCGGTKQPRRLEKTDGCDRAYQLGRQL